MAHGKDSGSSYENSSSRVAPNRHLKGDKKYKEVIAKDNNGSMGKNLPFSFIKPPRRWQPKRDVFHVCDFCFSVSQVNKNTVGVDCSGCSKFSKVHEANSFTDEKDLNSYLELLQVK